MKTVTMSFAASTAYKMPNPDRTATRSISDDVTFAEFPSRGAMLTCLEMQASRASNRRDWQLPSARQLARSI
jgi:hypothetical protein